MQRSRRKKILIWVLLIILLLVAFGYAYRYPLIRKYQYSRLKKLHCESPFYNLPGRQDCMDRIWAHRVNTIERYEILRDKFVGFETDIVYDNASRTYSVYHPPKTETENLLPLSEYLSHVDFKEKQLWLDTRGVDSVNMFGALVTLQQLIDTTTIRYPVIVELYDIPTARFFAENGFLVSLNVSETLLKSMIEDKLLSDSLYPLLKKVHFVSQDYRYIQHLKKYFPDKPILTWRPEFEAFTDTKELQQILDDDKVSIVLVSIKSRYYK